VRAVIRLLWSFIVRPLRRDLIRTALTIVSVALGVAVVIAIELAGEAAVGSFRSSLESLLGKTDLQITANGGVDETWMARLAAMPRNLRVAPVIEMRALMDGVGPVTVYGIDAHRSSSREKRPGNFQRAGSPARNPRRRDCRRSRSTIAASSSKSRRSSRRRTRSSL